MSRRSFPMALMLAAGLGLALAAHAQQGIETLQGNKVSDEPAPVTNKRTLAIPGGFGVAWEKQPPLIPHPIDKYSIDLRQNGCLKCHSPATYEIAKAPKVGDSHFYDRDGNRLENVAPRRYFCTQCHAAQAGAIPLVDNQFGDR